MKNITHNFLYILLFSPIIAYIYSEILKLPKTITHVFVLCVFVMGIILIIEKLVIRNAHINFPKYLWFLGCYATYRLIWYQFANVNLHPLTMTYYSILNYSILFMVVLICNISIPDRVINKSVLIIKITIILAAVVSIMQVFDQSIFNPINLKSLGPHNSIYQIRRASIFGFSDPNEVGLSYLPLVSVFTGFLLVKNNNKMYIFFTFLTGVTAILTNARYVMIGFLILTGQYIVYKKVKFVELLKYIFILFCIFMIFHFFLLYSGYNYSEWFQQRIFAEGSITETTRYKAFSNFVHFFPQHIFFGTGVHLTDEIREASRLVGSSQIHVAYLSHLVSYGLIGSFFLFGFWFMLAKKFYQTGIKTNYWGSFFAFLIYLWAQVTLVNYSIFFTGLIFAFVFDKYFQDKFIKFDGLVKK